MALRGQPPLNRQPALESGSSEMPGVRRGLAVSVGRVCRGVGIGRRDRRGKGPRCTCRHMTWQQHVDVSATCLLGILHVDVVIR